jgi:hypothetical protein
MNNATNTSTEIETPSFAILASGNLPSAYKNIAVKWSEVCDNEPFFVIRYDRFKKNKWIVKFAHDFAYVTSAQSLASAIRYIENFNQEA